MSMAHGWTAERRRKQSEAILHWEPWKSSSGPTTAAGKARSSRNAFKGGERTALREELTRIREMMRDLDNDFLG
jgi:hypothetical protein